MPENSEERNEESTEGPQRFDAEAVRRILRRAAEEQERLEIERPDSYSVEELEEIATETGISREAVRAALEAYRDPTAPGAGVPAAADPRRGFLGWLESRLPASWSGRSKRVVLVGVAAGLFALLLVLPGVGPVVLWATVLAMVMLLVLLLIGLT